MAEVGQDGAGVKDFVEAEGAREGVGAFGCVGDGPEGVEQSSDEDEEHCWGVGGKEVADEHDDSPAQQEVEGHVDPAWGAEPEHPEADPQGGRAPDDPEDRGAFLRWEGKGGDRGVGPGNEQEDVAVIQPAEELLRCRLPVDAVVQRRDAKK